MDVKKYTSWTTKEALDYIFKREKQICEKIVKLENEIKQLRNDFKVFEDTRKIIKLSEK